jgi:hypothetical protein
MITAALALSVLALLLAAAAAVLAVRTMRQSGAVATTLNRHRLGHEQREGSKDPAADRERRRLNLGPSRAVGERRRSPGHLLPPEDSWNPEDAPTAETAAVDLPTREARAVRPTLPRPGQIGQR